jgi:hypothetical protein
MEDARMNLRTLALAILVGALGLAGTAQAQGSKPVVIGGDPDYDACGSIGQIKGLRADGDGFLSVRAGPGTRYARTDKLVNGDRVYICADRAPWLGIVYAKDGKDCGVSSPWPKARPYTGPCRSGWVHRNWVRIIAG